MVYPMHYRSLNDLSNLLRSNLGRVPSVDMVVGVPRSGLLVATILALLLNKPMGTIDSLLAHTFIKGGYRSPALKDMKHVLVVDDTVNTGKQIKALQQQLSTLPLQITYLTAYYNPSVPHVFDIALEACPLPRFFEWNILHHPLLDQACFDMDGVLCEDPTPEQNDDGENYRKFLIHAKPLCIPTIALGHIVTSRLDKYRQETADWLRRNEVKYSRLHLLKGVTAAERASSNMHASFKASVYNSLPLAPLFVESNPLQSREIFQLSGKPVYCYTTNEFYSKAGIRQNLWDAITLNRPIILNYLRKIKRRMKL